MVLSLFLMSPLAGCDAKSSPLLPVRGRVTLDDQPLTRGTVTFHAETAKADPVRPIGTIGNDGMYAIYTNYEAGAPPGAYRVAVVALEAVTRNSGGANPAIPRSLIPDRYNRSDSTPLRVTVAAGASPEAYDLKLESHVP